MMSFLAVTQICKSRRTIRDAGSFCFRCDGITPLSITRSGSECCYIDLFTITVSAGAAGMTVLQPRVSTGLRSAAGQTKPLVAAADVARENMSASKCEACPRPPCAGGAHRGPPCLRSVPAVSPTPLCWNTRKNEKCKKSIYSLRKLAQGENPRRVASTPTPQHPNTSTHAYDSVFTSTQAQVMLTPI